MIQNYDEDAARHERRAKRLEEMKKEKIRHQKKMLLIKRILLFAVPVICLIFIIVLITNLVKKNIQSEVPSQEEIFIADDSISQNEVLSDSVEMELVIPEQQLMPYAASKPEEYGIYEGYTVHTTENTGYIWDEAVISQYALLIDASTGEIIGQKDANTRINPASMTKILTLLVAVENIENLDDTVTIDIETTDYTFSNDLSAVGFALDEEVTIRDLLYGTILSSGGDAAYALARYVAGSEEEFVVMMNEKLEELGLSDTAHFTNCVGMYNENHYCTLTDMAMILKAAVSNELCREVLSTHIYTTSSTTQHPDGIEISNWFLRRIEDKDTHGEVLCAKTGFVAQSGNCAASYAISNDGNQYICVTGMSTSAWRCIYDHVQIYDDYTK